MLDSAPPAPKARVIEGVTGPWELVIGLEVHAQIATESKLFSGASTQVGAEPNSQVSFIDAGMPGMLPVVNEGCIAQAVRTGLGLKARINLRSAFDRKNYFYPDLPQGYQISQLFHPLVGEGEVWVEMPGGTARRVRIERIHVEQDAGKSIHDMDPQMSFVDLNRTGVALMEIVSRPDIRGPEEAAAYVSKLRQIMRYLGTCDGDMQHGNLRADVNVSVCRPGAWEAFLAGDPSGLGTRCEIKNMNSLRFIQAAIEYEARRQIAILEDGGSVTQETRLYDPDRGETRSMRSKEEAHDYRYFPDPDLLPLEIEQAWVDDLAAHLPELPDEKKTRFIRDFGLSDYDASVLTAELERSDYFDEVLDQIDLTPTWTVRRAPDQKGMLISAKGPADWVINGLLGRLKADNDRPIEESPLTPRQLADIILLISDGVISTKIAKDLFEIVYTEGGDPRAIVEARGMRQVTDTGAIEAAVDQVIAENPAQVEKARANPKLAGWFVGQVMKATGGKANPAAVNALVNSRLGL